MSKFTKHLSFLFLFFTSLGFIHGQIPSTKTVNEEQVVAEIWLSQTGSELADIQLESLLSVADSTQVLTQLTGEATTQSDYLARVRGYLKVENSGDYQIKLRGGSAVALSFLLSDGQNIYNQALSVSKDISRPEASSYSCYLEEGDLYYFELLRKVGDNTLLADDWSVELKHAIQNIDLTTTGTASQSSAIWDANRAIDGIIDGQNHSRTSITYNMYWQVELAQSTLINEVTLHDSTINSLKNQLKNFAIILLDELGNEVFKEYYHTDGGYVDVNETFLLSNTGIEAKTIKITQDLGTVKGRICLAEVQAGLRNTELIDYQLLSYRPILQTIDLTAGTATQLNDLWDANRAIDGIIDGSNPSRTSITYNRHWQVELEQSKLINEVTLYDTTYNGLKKQLKNFAIILLDELGNEVFKKYYHIDGGYVDVNETFVLSNVGIEAKTIKIAQDLGTVKGRICLAEVQAKGIPATPDPNGYTIIDQDADGDELRDSWEITYNFSLTGAELGDKAALSDPDLDFASNYEESILETDPFTAASFAGYMQLERWEDMPYFHIYQALEDTNFYEEPDELFRFFNSDLDWHEHYDYKTTRIRGYITPSTSGYYHIYLSTRGESQLLIGKTAGELGRYDKYQIIQLELNDFIAEFTTQNWEYKANNKSPEIYLEQGQPYYVEILNQVEHYSNQPYKLAWQKVGQDIELIPSTNISSYYIPSDDLDDDYLPDAWETQYGLDITDKGQIDLYKQGEYGDFDLDGLNNREEYLLGTNPANTDTDNDGLDDKSEITYGANPLVVDYIASQVYQEIDLVDLVYTNESGSWIISDETDALESQDWRNEISFNFNLEQAGIYQYEILASIIGENLLFAEMNVDIEIDGYLITRHQLASPNGIIATLKAWTPWLEAGEHIIVIRDSSSNANHKLSLGSISINKLGGLDLNQDGIIDDIEQELINLGEANQIISLPATSYTSPVFIEGQARYAHQVSVDITQLNQQSTQAQLNFIESGHWYANIDLEADNDTTIAVNHLGDLHNQQVDTQWLTTDLAHCEDTLIIRQSDSLKLASLQSDLTTLDTATVTITTPSAEIVILDLVGDYHIYPFAEPGIYSIDLTSAQIDRTISVDVKGGDFSEQINIYLNRYLNYYILGQLNGLDWATTQAAELLITEQIDQVAVNIGIQQAGMNQLIARLPQSTTDTTLVSPIVGVQNIAVHEVIDSVASDDLEVEWLPGVESIISTSVVIPTLPQGGYVVIEINTNGASFTDGTRIKTFYINDISASGIIDFAILRAAGVTGLCHSIKVYDANGNLIYTS